MSTAARSFTERSWAHSRGRRLTLLSTCISDNGGAEMQCAELAAWMRRRGWGVTSISMTAPGRIPEPLLHAGVSIESLDMPPGSMDPRALLRLKRLLHRDQPHVLHAHMVHANLMARAVRLIEDVPVLICTLHGARMYTPRGDGWKAREVAHRLTDRLADVTTAVSEDAGKYYAAARAVSTERLRVIPNGVDIVRFSPNNSARRRIRQELGIGSEFAWISVGRFQPVKDHAVMLRAFARVARKYEQSVLLLAGDGPLRDTLAGLAADLGIAGKVRFLGPRNDTAALLNGADAFVLSSLFEGLPMVVLEAAATGLPIVSTDAGGTREAVADGVTGWLSPVGDPEALATSMLRIAAMGDADRRRMGLAGCDLVRHKYRLDLVMDGWERIYEQLLTRSMNQR